MSCASALASDRFACLVPWLGMNSVKRAMWPKLFLLVELGMYLEELLGCHVDVVRRHRNMNELLQKEIEKDGIYVIQA